MNYPLGFKHTKSFKRGEYCDISDIDSLLDLLYMKIQSFNIKNSKKDLKNKEIRFSKFSPITDFSYTRSDLGFYILNFRLKIKEENDSFNIEYTSNFILLAIIFFPIILTDYFLFHSFIATTILLFVYFWGTYWLRTYSLILINKLLFGE